jgi:hypothetical protein
MIAWGLQCRGCPAEKDPFSTIAMLASICQHARRFSMRGASNLTRLPATALTKGVRGPHCVGKLPPRSLHLNQTQSCGAQRGRLQYVSGIASDTATQVEALVRLRDRSCRCVVKGYSTKLTAAALLHNYYDQDTTTVATT